MTFVLYFFKDVLSVPNSGVGTAPVAGAALIPGRLQPGQRDLMAYVP